MIRNILSFLVIGLFCLSLTACDPASSRFVEIELFNTSYEPEVLVKIDNFIGQQGFKPVTVDKSNQGKYFVNVFEKMTVADNGRQLTARCTIYSKREDKVITIHLVQWITPSLSKDVVATVSQIRDDLLASKKVKSVSIK